MYVERVASITGPGDPPSSTGDLSAIIQSVAEQLVPVNSPLVLPDTLIQWIFRTIVGVVPSPDRSGSVETAVLASSVNFDALINFPDWTAQVFIYAGLCLLLLGLMAWLGSHRLQRRAWGRQLALSGGGLFVVGSAWSTFLDLITYVLG